MKFAQLIVYGIEGVPITKTEAAKRAGYSDQKIIRHGSIDDMNLDQLYARMKTIKEKNEQLLEAKKILASTEELKPQSKDLKEESQPLPDKKDDPDSTSNSSS